MSALAERLVAAAKICGWRVTTAESCTGGLIAAALTEVGGSSAVFERGIVAYANETKTAWLDVPADLIESDGAVSESVAAAMATGALAHGADLALSVTGVAGPGGGSAEKPVGTVCFGFATSTGCTTETRLFAGLDRAGVRRATVEHALERALAIVQADTRAP